MQAIILLGGKGTRLQDLYPGRPKALAPVAGRPFLEWQLGWLARNGIRDVHLAAGHLAANIQDWVSSSKTDGLVTVSVEPQALGTGGGLKFTEPHIRTDPFLILNGDSLLPNLDFQAFAKYYQNAGTLLSLAITRIEAAGRYGTVEFDVRQRLTAFREKAAHTSGWINGGVYLAHRTIFDRIESGKLVSLENDVFPTLCTEGQLGIFASKPPLLDMGTPDGIQAMERYLHSQSV